VRLNRKSKPLLVHITTVPASLTFLRGQVGYIGQQGIQIRIISSPGSGLEEFARIEGVPVDAIEMSRRITPLKDLWALFRLVQVLRKYRPDIVHSHTPKGGLLGMLAATLVRVPIRIYHARGLPYVTAQGVTRILLRWTERISCSLAHRVICVSHSVQHELKEDRLCNPSKMCVLGPGSGNGVDSEQRFNPKTVPTGIREHIREQYGIPDDGIVIGFVGRIVRDKGVVELAEAWTALRSEFPCVYLMIVGEPEARDAVPESLINMFETDPRVILAGQQKNISHYYAAMDIVTLPTYREGFPNVLLEAAAMALPVVSTQVMGAAEAARDGITGRLVPARDPKALYFALRSYIQDSSLRIQHGSEGRMWVSSVFKPQVIWDALYQEYHTLLTQLQLP
jgi:glycosyltransferase involved in cell wall biosynthesis